MTYLVDIFCMFNDLNLGLQDRDTDVFKHADKISAGERDMACVAAATPTKIGMAALHQILADRYSKNWYGGTKQLVWRHKKIPAFGRIRDEGLKTKFEKP